MSSDTTVTLIAKYKIRDTNQVANVRSLVGQFVSKVQENEPEACLQYSWSILEDQTLCCQESYKDVGGVMKHLENVGSLFAPFLGLVEFESSEVYAPPSSMAEIRESPIGRWNPAYYEVIDGVRRDS